MNVLLSKDTGLLAMAVRAHASRVDTALGRLSATPCAVDVALADLAALRRKAKELDHALRADRREWAASQRAPRKQVAA